MYSIDAHAKFNFTPGFFGTLGYGAKGTDKIFENKNKLIPNHLTILTKRKH